MNPVGEMAKACEMCGGATEAGMPLPPCLCELGEMTPSMAPPKPSGVPEKKGGTKKEARALRCPGCGGFLDAGVRRCSYCSIELASIRCWRCFELSFAGSEHCGRCAAVLGLEGDAGPTGFCCPSCPEEELHLIDVGEHRIEECPACTGVMLDHETLNRLTQRQEAEAGMRVLGAKRAQLAPQPMTYRKCPKCEQVMTPRNFGRRSGIIVDVCTDHGMWFDANELTAVLEFVATGGLADARRRDIDDAKQELRRRRLDALREQQNSQRAGLHVTGLGSSGALLSALASFDW